MSGNNKLITQFCISSSDDSPISYDVRFKDNTLVVTYKNEETGNKVIIFSLNDVEDRYSVDFLLNDGKYIMTAHKENGAVLPSEKVHSFWSTSEIFYYCHNSYRMLSPTFRDNNRKRTLYIVPYFSKEVRTVEQAEENYPLGFCVYSTDKKNTKGRSILYVLEATRPKGEDVLNITPYGERVNIKGMSI